MGRRSTHGADDTTHGGDLPFLIEGFAISLDAENLSARTKETYLEATARLTDFLAATGRPLDANAIRRTDIEAFIAELLTHWSAATAANRYRSLLRFFRYLAEEELIELNPMAHMRPPRVPEDRAPIPTADELKALLAVCVGRDSTARRDAAILRVFMGTGVRLAEIAGLRLEDVDLANRQISVFGKGRIRRTVGTGNRAAQALHRYLVVRRKHERAAEQALWLGTKGRMTESGIAQVVIRRAKEAGLPHLHPHSFRHFVANAYQASETLDGEIMSLMGWRSPAMLRRYASGNAAARALAATRDSNPGDRL